MFLSCWGSLSFFPVWLSILDGLSINQSNFVFSCHFLSVLERGDRWVHCSNLYRKGWVGLEEQIKKNKSSVISVLGCWIFTAEQFSQHWKSYFLVFSCKLTCKKTLGCNCSRIHFEDYSCLCQVVWTETCGWNDLDRGTCCSFSGLLHTYQPLSPILPWRWNKIFQFGSSECFYWWASDKFRCSYASLHAHFLDMVCSSCGGTFLSRDDITKSYLHFLFLFENSYPKKTKRGAGDLTFYFLISASKSLKSCL